jgi:hypothetical protein
MADNRGRPDLRDKLVERFGRFGEAFYMFVLGMIAISINGFAAYFLKYPLLFPSLAPTVFHVFRDPLDKEASPRNTITGHFIGIGMGYVALLVFGLTSTPSVIQEGATIPHILAAALSLGLTEAALISLNRPHPPAATSTLLVGLGVFKSPSEVLALCGGIVLLTVTMWTFNRSLGVPVPIWSPRERPEEG